jgi:hypothetical protein
MWVEEVNWRRWWHGGASQGVVRRRTASEPTRVDQGSERGGGSEELGFSWGGCYRGRVGGRVRTGGESGIFGIGRRGAAR